MPVVPQRLSRPNWTAASLAHFGPGIRTWWASSARRRWRERCFKSLSRAPLPSTTTLCPCPCSPRHVTLRVKR
eukprot:3526194-Rhodomonas_salina.1